MCDISISSFVPVVNHGTAPEKVKNKKIIFPIEHHLKKTSV